MRVAGQRAATRRRRGHMVALGAVLASVGAAYGQLAVSRPLAGYDVTTYSLPNWVEVSAAIRHLRLPLWDPFRLLGVPLLANPQTAVFYPLHWVLAFLPADRGQSISIVLHLAIAGAGAYLLATKALRLSPLAGIVAGAGFAVGGFAHAHAGQYEQVTALAWTPWALLAADAALRAERARRAGLAVAGLALAIAMAALAGHTQYLYMELVLVAIYGLFAADPVVRLSRVVAGELMGLALAAAQLLPSYLLSQRSVRTGGLAYAAASELSLPLHLLGTTFLPHYRSQPPLPVEWWAWAPWSVLALAMVGLATGATSRRKIALVVASGIGMVLSLGSSIPTFRVALTVIPGLNLFRVPARWLLLPSIAIPLLAAIGLDGIRQGERPRWPLLGLLATTGIVGGAISVNRSGAFAPDRLALLCGGLAAGAVAVGWAVTLRRVSAGAMVAGAIVVLVVVELLAGDVGTDLHRLRMPAGSLTATSATAAALGDLHGGRVLSVGGGSLDDHPRQRASLRPNANVFDRLRSPDGYDGGLLYTPAWVGAMRRLLRNPSFDPLLTLRPQVTGPLDPHVFSELDVTRVVAADTSVDLDQVLPAGSHKTGTVGTITIYETPSGGPVFLADGAAPPGLRLDRRASHPEELAVDVPPGIGGRTVVISEAWAPGWHSPQTALHVYDGLLLSFVAPSRPGRIKLGYRQPGLLVGSLISALTFLLLVVIAVAAVRR